MRHQSPILQPLHSWMDLYIYFDQFDIYHDGAWNLWNVIHHLISQNRILVEELKTEVIPHFESWIVGLLQDGECRNRLRTWKPEHQSDILRCFEKYELDDIEGIDHWYLPTIRHVMWNYHMRLCTSPSWIPNPSHLLSSANISKGNDPQQAGKCTNFSIYICTPD